MNKNVLPVSLDLDLPAWRERAFLRRVVGCWTYVILTTFLFHSSQGYETGELLPRCPQDLARTRYLKATPWGKCYEFHMEERTRRTANSICGSHGGHLVTIRDFHIQHFLLKTLKKLRWPRNGLWIGANDKRKEMEWRWVTGELVRNGYKNWASGQPSCGFFCFEDCAVMRWKSGGKWHDYRCNWIEDYSFVCEYDMLPPPPPTTTATTTTTTTEETTTTTTTTTTSSTTTTISSTNSSTASLAIVREESFAHNRSKSNSLEAEYLLHHSHGEMDQNKNTTEPSVIVIGVNGARVGHVKHEEPEASSSLNMGSMAGLIVGILIGLAAGMFLLFFLLFRRRRRKQLREDGIGVSYANPYYGEVKVTPCHNPDTGNEDNSGDEPDDAEGGGAYGGASRMLTAVADDSSCKLLAGYDKGTKMKHPPPPSPLHDRPKCVMNTYDTPPSIAGQKAAAGKTEEKSVRSAMQQHPCEQSDNIVASSTCANKYGTSAVPPDEEENYYDEVRSQPQSSTFMYDSPRASSEQQYGNGDNFQASGENLYYNEEENLYESMENLRAALEREWQVSQHTPLDLPNTDGTMPRGEEGNLYVPFALDNDDSGF